MQTLRTDIESFEAARHRVALEDATGEEALTVSGPELTDWIEGVISRPLPDLGDMGYALMLTPKATLIADFWAWRDDTQTVLLEPPQALLAGLKEALERFRISAKVTIDREPRGRVELVGPLAHTALSSALGTASLDISGDHVAEHDGLRISARNRHGLDGICVAAPSERLAVAHNTLARSVAELGGSELTPAAASWLRIVCCHPDGSDIGDDRFIAETPLLDRGVDLSKPQAFIGMQPLLRVSHRGHVNRRTLVLLADAEAAWRPDERIELDGKNVGTLGPTGFASTSKQAALAYLRMEAGPGQVVAVGDPPTYAEVREPPVIERVEPKGP